MHLIILTINFELKKTLVKLRIKKTFFNGIKGVKTIDLN